MEKHKVLSQSDKFKQMAKELETDDDESVFDKALKNLATPKQPKKP